MIPGETERKPVVRFAPSPTGHLHIGGLRTALFNYFYARNLDGIFVLRIEDTDMTRSSRDMADQILDGLRWLDIRWDIGPYYQSEHFDTYRAAAYRLVEERNAYRCFCTPEAIDARRQASGATNKDDQLYKYDRQCLHLSEEEIHRNLSQEMPFVIRFRVPEGKTAFKDRIHKEMTIANNELDDFVLLKSDGSPTYHLSVVVDDSDMAITDVIRGDDHILNTYKQILLFTAMGKKPPRFAHLPLILGPDKKKLSKRHGETSVLEFKRAGYLPESIINYLSQLSWIPGDTKKLFTMDELIAQFSLGKLSRNSPVFDYDKLRFMNSRAIQDKPAADLLRLLEEDLSFRNNFEGVEPGKKEALIDLVKPRMKTLRDFDSKFAIYLTGPLNYANSDFQKLRESFPLPVLIRNVDILVRGLEPLDPSTFTPSRVEEAIRGWAQANDLKAADLIHTARFALTAEVVSPSIFDVFAFFGKPESLKRVNDFSRFLENN
ncbi:MAG: glutamate--tRNA ligase [Candidatus Omnitrophota bacterium]